MLVACGLAWGSTQSLAKVAVSTGHGPFGLLFWQLALGVLVAGPLSLARGRGLVLTRASLRFGLVVALVGTVLPGTTFYVSVARLPAGVMSVLISTVPMLAFGLALTLGRDRASARRLIGLGLGLGGVLLLVGPEAALPDPAMAIWVPFALLGPLLYACESNFVAAHGMAGQDPLQAMTLVSLIGAALVLPVALASGQWIDPIRPWGAPEWAFLASSVVHVLTYAAFVGLAARAGAAFASQSSYLVTASGLVWAAALLGERPSPYLGLALILMLGGLALVSPRPAPAPPGADLKPASPLA